MTTITDTWFVEHADGTMTQINSYGPPPSGKVIGHFTAMVQDKTNVIGCAVLKYSTIADGGVKHYHVYFVCNYGFTNISDQAVYIPVASGNPPGHGCATKTDHTFPGLCNKHEVVKPEPYKPKLEDMEAIVTKKYVYTDAKGKKYDTLEAAQASKQFPITTQIFTTTEYVPKPKEESP